LEDLLIMLGAIMLVALIVFFCVLIFGKEGRRRRKQRRHHHQREGYREQFQKNVSDIKHLVLQHPRRHRREHRTINPTLAQTGGLPPIHEHDKRPPPPPP
jgi:hypothetical protein